MKLKLDHKAVTDHCREIIADLESGSTDRDTLVRAVAIVRHIASWQKGYQCEVTVQHIADIART